MNAVSKEIKRYNHLLGEIEAVYHDISFRMGISDSVSKILYTICNMGEHCPLSLICRQTGMSKQTVNSAIRRLEEQGIVRLTAVDGKSKDVCLTDAGKDLARRTAQRIIEMENDILSSWPQEDVQRYLALTERFLQDLEYRAKDL